MSFWDSVYAADPMTQKQPCESASVPALLSYLFPDCQCTLNSLKP